MKRRTIRMQSMTMSGVGWSIEPRREVSGERVGFDVDVEVVVVVSMEKNDVTCSQESIYVSTPLSRYQYQLSIIEYRLSS